MKTQVPAEAIAAWDRGEKVEAIRIVREHTGLGLQESMHALESGAYTVHTSKVIGAAQVPAEAAAAAARGDLIQAIKLTRQTTGLGLKEARELVEQSLQVHKPSSGQSTPSTGRSGLAPGEVPRQGVSASLIAVLVAIAAAVLVYIYRG